MACGPAGSPEAEASGTAVCGAQGTLASVTSLIPGFHEGPRRRPVARPAGCGDSRGLRFLAAFLGRGQECPLWDRDAASQGRLLLQGAGQASLAPQLSRRCCWPRRPWQGLGPAVRRACCWLEGAGGGLTLGQRATQKGP